MKVKMKLDTAALKQFFLQHGEKIVLGGVLVGLVGFVYSAVGHEVLPVGKQPDKLLSKAEEASQHIKNSAWDPKQDDLEVETNPRRIYPERTRRDPLAPKDYVLRTPFNEPEGRRKGRRDDPKLYPLEAPQVSAGFGTFALLPEAAPIPAGQAAAAPRPPSVATAVDARYWAVVTGLVPINKQAAEFTRVFANAVDFTKGRDEPDYIGYIVERAEVDDPSAPLKWEKASADKDFLARWSAPQKDLVDPGVLNPLFAMPLGPLVSPSWTDKPDTICHPPQVRPLAEEMAAAQQALQQPAQDAVKPAGDEFEGGANPAAKRPAAMPEPTRQVGTQRADVEFWLFRYFDFKVLPGKKYAYRVRLGLKNPNFNEPVKFLRNPEKSKQLAERLGTDFSEPTTVVTIPSANGILVGPIADPKELVVSVHPYVLSKEHGITAMTSLKGTRGTWVSLTKSVKAYNPATRASVDLDNVKFDNDILLADVRGGKLLPGKDKLSEPAQVLLLDRDGNLTVRDELDDAPAIEEKESALKGAAAAPAGGMKSVPQGRGPTTPAAGGLLPGMEPTKTKPGKKPKP